MPTKLLMASDYPSHSVNLPFSNFSQRHSTILRLLTASAHLFHKSFSWRHLRLLTASSYPSQASHSPAYLLTEASHDDSLSVLTKSAHFSHGRVSQSQLNFPTEASHKVSLLFLRKLFTKSAWLSHRCFWQDRLEFLVEASHRSLNFSHEASHDVSVLIPLPGASHSVRLPFWAFRIGFTPISFSLFTGSPPPSVQTSVTQRDWHTPHHARNLYVNRWKRIFSDLSPPHPLLVCHHWWSTIYIKIPSFVFNGLKIRFIHD